MYKHVMPLLIGAGLSVITTAWSQTARDWTLNTSVQHAIQVAPEMKSADAEVGIQQGKQEQADAWPNPTIYLKVDDKIGIEEGSGGYDVAEFAFSQPLPLGRLDKQRKQAQAELASAQAKLRQQQLMLEYQVARRFHQLQLAQAKLDLAKQRLQEASQYQPRNRGQSNGDQIVRYLTPLENMRMEIILQTAQQSLDMAEGEFSEAAAAFKSLLNIPFDDVVHVPALTAVKAPQDVSVLDTALQDHPALTADKQSVAAAQAGIAVADAKRFDDPTLTLFRQNEYLSNQRQDVNGIILSVHVPLWNSNKGQVTQARYLMHQKQADLVLKRRQLSIGLHKNYLHLKHLIEQAENYRGKLLQPTQGVLKLTRQGFKSGALNILNLIDANDTYFETQQRYYELLEAGWLELAELRKSAGLSLLNSHSVLHSGEVK